MKEYSPSPAYPKKGIAIASLIIGGLSVLLVYLGSSMFPLFLLIAFPLAVIAFVLGIVTLVQVHTASKVYRSTNQVFKKASFVWLASGGIVGSILSFLVYLLLVFGVAMMLFLPNPDYRSKQPELYSVAINSILETRGFHHGGERIFPSEISVIEKDSFGRVLFSYTEYNTVSTHNLVICQKSDGDYSYFYPDYCFISAPTDSFSPEKIEELKTKNDWGENLNLEKCIKAEIVNMKHRGSVRDDNLEKAFEPFFGSFAGRWTYYLTSDNYGRSVYLGYGYTPDEQVLYVVILFNTDGSSDAQNGFFVLDDYYEYQDELRDLKERNGWNTPL